MRDDHLLLSGRRGPATPKRTGIVRKSGLALADDQGEFNAMIETLFYAPWASAFDVPRFDHECAELQRKGFHGYRAIGVLGGESWVDRMIPTSPVWQFIQRIAFMADRGYQRFGQRAWFTIFGGQIGAETPAKRWEIVRAIPPMIVGRESHFLGMEIFNEGYDEGMGNDEMRAMGEWLQAHVPFPVAISTRNPNIPNNADIGDLYKGAKVQALTHHVKRDTDGDGGVYEPTWDLWEIQFEVNDKVVVDNEPPAPYSTIYEETDPKRLVIQAVIAWTLGGMWCLHNGPGKRGGGSWDAGKMPEYLAGWPGWEATTAGLRGVLSALPAGMANWTRWNGHWSGNPVSVERAAFDNGGIFKALTVENGEKLVHADLWVRRPLTVTLQRPIRLREIALDGSGVIRELSGSSFTLDPSRPETVFVGEYL